MAEVLPSCVWSSFHWRCGYCVFSSWPESPRGGCEGAGLRNQVLQPPFLFFTASPGRATLLLHTPLLLVAAPPRNVEEGGIRGNGWSRKSALQNGAEDKALEMLIA